MATTASEASTLLDGRMRKLLDKLEAATGDARLDAWTNKTGTERLKEIGYGAFGEVFVQPVDNPEARLFTVVLLPCHTSK